MPTHKWHLVVPPKARADIDDLPSRKDLMGVFHSLRLLLEAENPLAVQGVKELVDPRYGGQYRQRSGDYRIFFAIEHGNVTFMKHNL